MSGFSAGWLTLREPADTAARSRRATRSITDALAHDAAPCVLDLAAGTGSNLRYLAEELRGEQRWLLVDHDPSLLMRVRPATASWAESRGYDANGDADSLWLLGGRLDCRVSTRCLDLASLDDPALFADTTLVTASALLDLVSESWLLVLAGRCREGGAAALFALIYDGRIVCAPEEPEDELVRALVNRHQHTDKGFGEALGPDAAGGAERCFVSLGYRVERDASDWVLTPEAGELQRQLIAGWADAAVAMAPEHSASIRGWRDRRLAHVAAGRSRLVVGHQDLTALLPTPPKKSRPFFR